ncbi:UvrB/UvrC motif-containing protein [Verrucomicrobiota bacterium]
MNQSPAKPDTVQGRRDTKYKIRDTRIMKCEMCENKEAIVHLKQSSDGDIKELHLCGKCAQEKGLNIHESIPLTDFLFGMEVQQGSSSGGADKTCFNCGMSRSQFREKSRLGCAVCYETFSSDLESMLEDMQKKDSHIGKIPAGEKAAAELSALQEALNRAVVSQDFEKAAMLRDRIEELKKITTLSSLVNK